MNGHVRKRGNGWVFVVDKGRPPARRCESGLKGHVIWVGEHDGDTCPHTVTSDDGIPVLCGERLAAPTAMRRQVWSKGYSRKGEAEKALRAALSRLDAGDDALPVATTFAELVAAAADHWRVNDRPRTRTRTRYAQLIAPAVEAIGGLRLERIKTAHIQQILDASTARGLAPRTVAQQRAALSSVFTFAVRGGLIATNPVRATSTPTAQKPKLLTPNAQQLRSLIDAAVGTTWEIPVLLAATTAARRAEALGLRWSCVDLDRGRVRIDETLQRIDGKLVFVPPKTERARREIPLPAFAVERLRAHRADQAQRRLRLGAEWHDTDLVCERGDGSPLDPDALSHGFGRIAAKAGLDGVRLHDLRHGVLTALAKNGTPAYVTSKIAGHSSVNFTANTYTHADEESVDRALAGLEAAFGS